jgi:apolipoprotein D and lipocalin family protein
MYSTADIVADYAINWAIVQTQKWNTLYILSREREPATATVDVSIYNLRSVSH